MCFDAHASVHRKPAVLVGQHLFGLETLQQAPAHEGTQNASSQGGLHLGHSIRINADGWLEDHVCLGGLKHAIDHTDVEVNMFVEAGAEAVNEGHRADMQCGLAHIRRTGADCHSGRYDARIHHFTL